MGCMSASDAAPLPRLGEVFFDVRGSSRSMRLSWYSDTGVAVFSIWQGGTCTGTFRLPIDDLPRMVEALQRGPRGAALPAADGRDLTGDRPRRGIAGVPADLAVASVGGFPDYATGQQIAPPVTGEFRSLGPGDSSAGFPGYGDAGARNTSADRQLSQQPSPAASLPGADSRNGDPSRYGGPSYAGDPLGSGSYPVYRDPEGPEASFPGYADDGPPPPSAYRDPGPASYRDDPLGGGSAPPTAMTRWAAAARPPTAMTRWAAAARPPTATTPWAAAATGTTRPARSPRWGPAATRIARPARRARWTHPAR